MRRNSRILILCIMVCTILVLLGIKNFERSELRETFITNHNTATDISNNANISQNFSTFTVLVFSKTAVVRHKSIPAGIAAVKALGRQHNFRVEASEDATIFTDARLAKYQVVVFLNTTGNILNTAQEAAFRRFIQKGRGFVGIHSATDTEYNWPWYGRLVGTYFENHPRIQRATINVINSTHLSTKNLPNRWTRMDEWYNFRNNPSANVTVLAKLDESTYSGGTMGRNHPISWYHRYDGGRAWYTGMGHTSETYSEPLFLEHILGGIRWAAGATSQEIKIYLPMVSKN